MTEEQAYCVCLNVKYSPVHVIGGGIIERWKCVSCKRPFIPYKRAEIKQADPTQAEREILGKIAAIPGRLRRIVFEAYLEGAADTMEKHEVDDQPENFPSFHDALCRADAVDLAEEIEGLLRGKNDDI